MKEASRYADMYLNVFASHVLKPGKPEVGGVLIALGNAVHQIQQHLGVLLELLHLHRIREYHVQVTDQLLHLNIDETNSYY